MRLRSHILLLCLLLPALFLAGIGLLVLRRQATSKTQTSRMIVQEIAEDVEQTFREIEEAIRSRLRQLDRLDYDAIQITSNMLSQQHGLLAEFFVFGMPGLDPAELPPMPYAAVSESQKMEFHKRQLTRTVTMYQAEARMATTLHERIIAFNQLARCYFKQRNWQQAIQIDRLLIALPFTMQGDFALQAAAHLRLAEAYLAVEQPQAAYNVIEQLLKRLATGAWRDPGDFLAGQAEEVLHRIAQNYGLTGKLDRTQLVHYRDLMRLCRESISPLLSESSPGQFRYLSVPSTKQLMGYATFLRPTGTEWIVGWLVASETLRSLLEHPQQGDATLTIVRKSEEPILASRYGSSRPALVELLDHPAGWSIVLERPVASSGIDPRLGLLAVALIMLLVGLVLLWREFEMMRMQQEFINSVSHELRKPLNNLKYFLGMIEEVHEADETARSNWEWANSALFQLQNMIENVLSLARLRQRRFPFHFEIGYVEGVIESTVHDSRIHAREEGFKIRLSIANDLPEIQFDATAIHLAVANLLDNALKYSKAREDIPEKLIEVRVFSWDSGINIEVRDQGVGILPRNQRNVFRRFYREKRDLTMPAGIGLGLTIAQLFVEAHGGRIEIESTPMQGSIFRIWLPEYRELS